MKARCYNPNNKKFYRYGGRGIIVCDRWRGDFQAFYLDMGPKPSTRHSIERVNNDGDYDPNNCVWAIPGVQARNRSTTRFITMDGKTKCLADWEITLGLRAGKIREMCRRTYSYGRPKLSFFATIEDALEHVYQQKQAA